MKFHATFATHVYNSAHVMRLLNYLQNAELVYEDKHLKNVQLAKKARSIINARANVERVCALSCKCCHKFNAQTGKSYCKGCDRNLACERNNLKKVFAHLKSDVCAVCQKKSNNIVLDHCHVTGKARSWCCTRCNTTLGLITCNPTGFIIHCKLKYNLDISNYEYSEKYKLFDDTSESTRYEFDEFGTCINK